MNASMVPFEAASKHSNGGMIWPPGKDLDAEPPAAHLVDDLRQPLGRPLVHVERRGPGRGHSPLDLRLRDDVGGVDDGASGGGRHHTARPRDEPASIVDHAGPFAWAARCDASDRSRDPGLRPQCWWANAAMGESRAKKIGAGSRRLRCLTYSDRSTDATSRSRHLIGAAGSVICIIADQERIGLARGV